MTNIISTNVKQGKPTQGKIKQTVAKMTACHPNMTFLAMFIVAPVFILFCVFSFTSAVMLPISLVLGWI